jgi:hypothetical protein
MGPIQRRIRQAINPVSTGLTRWWLGIGRRQVPRGRTARGTSSLSPRAFRGVPSPGQWIVPTGQRPGWQWLPEYGASPNLRAMPRWVRIWYRTPLIDRYAYEWMWWHGGWDVLVPTDNPEPPPDAGVREPRRPRPAPPAGAAALTDPVEFVHTRAKGARR